MLWRFFKTKRYMSKGEGQLHNKLVRDKIPAYLERLGVDYEVEVVSDQERLSRLLLDKLEEETQEAAVADDEHLLEELADIETVIDGILKVKGLTREELLAHQILKDETNGKLERGVFLVRSATSGSSVRSVAPEEPEVETEMGDIDEGEEKE